MATTRTVTTTADGVARVEAHVTAASVVVIAEPGRTRAEATVTNRTNDPAADAMVDNGTVEAENTTITIRTAPPPTNFVVGDMVAGNVYGSMHVTGSHFGQGNLNVGAAAFDGGQVSIGNLVAGAVAFGRAAHAGDVNIGAVNIGVQSNIEVTVRVPEGSCVEFSAGSGHITTKGKLGNIELATSGAVRIEHAASVYATSNGGSIRIDHFTGHADVTANGGHVRVFGADDAQLFATANGGHIVHGRNLDARCTANGGSIRSEKVT